MAAGTATVPNNFICDSGLFFLFIVQLLLVPHTELNHAIF